MMGLGMSLFDGQLLSDVRVKVCQVNVHVLLFDILFDQLVRFVVPKIKGDDVLGLEQSVKLLSNFPNFIFWQIPIIFENFE